LYATIPLPGSAFAVDVLKLYLTPPTCPLKPDEPDVPLLPEVPDEPELPLEPLLPLLPDEPDEPEVPLSPVRVKPITNCAVLVGIVPLTYATGIL